MEWAIFWRDSKQNSNSSITNAQKETSRSSNIATSYPPQYQSWMLIEKQTNQQQRLALRPSTPNSTHIKIMVDTLCFLLSSLPISVLRILDTEANKFYDRNRQFYDAALLTRCYTQNALRPFIDSETCHKRHFIKIPFINKGIEFIDLPSIFKDRSVTSSIPTYFQNSEPPIICYKYNKPIRNTVFNSNKLVSDLDIHANTPVSWDCKDSKFIFPAAGHIMTGNLKIISDSLYSF